jgi:HEPN domain-containing protein/predicted nucleotidyltransferase
MKYYCNENFSKLVSDIKLPPRSQTHEEKIKEITNIILEIAKNKIAFVILFGPFARGDWVCDSHNLDSITYQVASDYNILIITKAKKYATKDRAFRLEEHIIGRFNKLFKNNIHNLHVIIEPINYVNSEIERKKYFFADIKKNGVLLYDSGEFKLSKPLKLNLEERAKIAKEDYDNWLYRAKRFLRYFYIGISDNDLGGAAFHLYQATEMLFNCNLLVFNGYETKSHDLTKLNKFCSANCNQFLNIFPNINDEQRQSVNLLQEAYNQARYQNDYKIKKNQLEYLISRVEILLKTVEESCKNKIAMMMSSNCHGQ